MGTRLTLPVTSRLRHGWTFRILRALVFSNMPLQRRPLPPELLKIRQHERKRKIILFAWVIFAGLVTAGLVAFILIARSRRWF